jgi:hypothetical protein
MVGPGSLPRLRTITKPRPSLSANGAATRKPRDSMPARTSGACRLTALASRPIAIAQASACASNVEMS